MSSNVSESKLEKHLDNLFASSSNDDAGADDLLTEILLKQGYSLVEDIKPLEIDGLDLRSVGDGLVLAYLNEYTKPTLEQYREIVAQEPAKLIVVEDAFGAGEKADELKTNLAQLCSSRGIELWTA